MPGEGLEPRRRRSWLVSGGEPSRNGARAEWRKARRRQPAPPKKEKKGDKIKTAKNSVSFYL